MKKLSKIYLLLLSGLSLSPMAFAQFQVTLVNPLKAKTFLEFIGYVINFLFVASFVIAPLMIVIAGFLMVTSGSSQKPQENIERAKAIVWYTMWGVIVILLAKGFITFMLNKFGIQVQW